MADLRKVQNEKIKSIAQKFGINCILYGSGYPVREPNVVVIAKDSFNRGGNGYDVYIYPKGAGYDKPCIYYSIE